MNECQVVEAYGHAGFFMAVEQKSQLPSLSENLQTIRRARGMTQAELARAARLDASHISRLESGEFASARPDTLRRLAKALNCDPSELTGTEAIREATLYETNPEYRDLLDALERLDPNDRKRVIGFTRWVAEKAKLKLPRKDIEEAFKNVRLFPTRRATAKEKEAAIGEAGDGGDFPPPPIPIGDYIEKDADVPRALHAWVVPIDADAAAGPPRNPDDAIIPTTQLLNSLREVRDTRVKVVKILGDSMHPVLRNGWKVLLDPARNLFKPGQIVMVYIKDEGTSIGLLSREGERFILVKRNPEYSAIELRPGEWYPIGTITTIVEAPVEVE
jgi:transcriptional regulator with XRE-family HTH domain